MNRRLLEWVPGLYVSSPLLGEGSPEPLFRGTGVRIPVCLCKTPVAVAKAPVLAVAGRPPKPQR